MPTRGAPPSMLRVSRGLGVPRFTMTAHGGRSYAAWDRKSQAGQWNRSMVAVAVNWSVSTSSRRDASCWTIPDPNRKPGQDDEKWAFEGSPRGRRDATSTSPCATATCGRKFTSPASTPRPASAAGARWFAAAETPGGGQTDEITHNLLTLDEGTLYYNTNLGAVGAVSARDGHLQWISTYPRAKRLTRPARQAHGPFLSRLESLRLPSRPLLVAPADSESILAFDAG